MAPEEFPIGSYYAIVVGTSSAWALACYCPACSPSGAALGAALGTIVGALAGLNSFRVDTVIVYPGMVRKRWVLEHPATILGSIAVCSVVVSAIAALTLF